MFFTIVAPATPVNMSLHKPKLHRSTHNISTCTSSTESLREGKQEVIIRLPIFVFHFFTDHRSFVLKELLKTERNYIGSLETLMNVFLPRLETIMSPRDVRLLFPCQLEPLIALHNDLLSRLDERIEGRSRYHGMVGDIFGRLCSDKEVSQEIVNRLVVQLLNSFCNLFLATLISMTVFVWFCLIFQ